jgi:hypothetical protein
VNNKALNKLRIEKATMNKQILKQGILFILLYLNYYNVCFNIDYKFKSNREGFECRGSVNSCLNYDLILT